MKTALYLAGIAALIVATAFVIRVYGVRMRPPHVLLPAPEVLNDAKQQELERALAGANLEDRDHVLKFALDFTARSLWFSLGHPTTFVFPGDRARAANCIEYTYLFVVVFNAASRRAGLAVRAQRVRSLEARVFGMRLPLKGFADHDWSIVGDAADETRLYVDPTFYDAYLGWSLQRNVVGWRSSAPAGDTHLLHAKP